MSHAFIIYCWLLENLQEISDLSQAPIYRLQTCDLLHAIYYYYYYFEIILLLLLLLLQYISYITITITISITIIFVTISKEITSHTAIIYFPYTFYNNKHQIIAIFRLFNTN